MKDAVIFDFGGVIFKTRDYTPRLQWDQQLGLMPGTVERAVHNQTSWRAAQCGELSLDEYWADVASILGITNAQVQQLAIDFYSGDEIDAAVVDVIDRLRANGVPVALLSNDAAGLLRPRLARLGLQDRFEPLVISSEIGVMKPDARAYEAVLKGLNCPATTAIFIDDMAANISGAAALGIRGIHYQDGMNLADAVVSLLE